jgi:hypothetical protein
VLIGVPSALVDGYMYVIVASQPSVKTEKEASDIKKVPT